MSREIILDAGRWASLEDFYDALLDALGAPGWHGQNVNALVDSMVAGDINAVEPPYRITIAHAAAMPETVRAEVEFALSKVLEAEAEMNGDPGRIAIHYD